MNTKTLILGSLLILAKGAGIEAAQYSENIVGYVTLTLHPGFTMIANQLDYGSNWIGQVITGVPDGTIIYKFNSATGSFSINQFDPDEWARPEESLAPGEGAFIRIPGTNAVTVIFIGQVRQGKITNEIPVGFSIQSLPIPDVDGWKDFPAADGDVIYRFHSDTQSYSINTFDFDWSNPPRISIGESFFLWHVPPSWVWVRDFWVK